MITHRADLVLEVTAYDPAALEDDLNTAENIARGLAMKDGRLGVLVTQYDYTLFTVRVSGDVPYGQTRERRRWRPPSQPTAGSST